MHERVKCSVFTQECHISKTPKNMNCKEPYADHKLQATTFTEIENIY